MGAFGPHHPDPKFFESDAIWPFYERFNFSRNFNTLRAKWRNYLLPGFASDHGPQYLKRCALKLRSDWSIFRDNRFTVSSYPGQKLVFSCALNKRRLIFDVRRHAIRQNNRTGPANPNLQFIFGLCAISRKRNFCPEKIIFFRQKFIWVARTTNRVPKVPGPAAGPSWAPGGAWQAQLVFECFLYFFPFYTYFVENWIWYYEKVSQ